MKKKIFFFQKVLFVLEPIGKKISGIYDKDDETIKEIKKREKLMEDKEITEKQKKLRIQREEQQNKYKKDSEKYRPYYSNIPFKSAPKGATLQEITKYNLDKSEILLEIMKRYEGK